MKIIEFRLPVPVGLTEYQKLCIHLVIEASLNEMENGTGLEVFRNERFEEDGKGGVYTEKKYHMAKSMPNWMQSIINPKYTILTEKSWNMFPLSITKYHNEALSSVEFSIQTEVVSGLEVVENIFGLTGKDLKKRSIVFMDITKFNKSKAYNSLYDVTTHESEGVDFLPLKPDWLSNYTGDSVMCYKLIRINIPYFGLLASKIETYVANTLQDKLMFYTCSALCSLEKWYGLPIRILRRSEMECYDKLNQRFHEMNISSASTVPAPTGGIVVPTELYRDYEIPYVPHGYESEQSDDDENGKPEAVTTTDEHVNENEQPADTQDENVDHVEIQDERPEEQGERPPECAVEHHDESTVYTNAEIIHLKMQNLQPKLCLDSPYSDIANIYDTMIDPMENISSIDSMNSITISNKNLAEMCAEDALSESFAHDITPTSLELYGPVAIPTVEASEPESDSEFHDALETFDDQIEPEIAVTPYTFEKSHVILTEEVSFPEDSDISHPDGALETNSPPEEKDIAKPEIETVVSSKPIESDKNTEESLVTHTQPIRRIDPSPDAPVTFTGYLFKLGRGFSSRNWSLRYIIVCGINMYYFDNKDDIKPKNTICIRDSRIAFVGPYINRSFVFSITTRNRSVYYFSADAQDSVKRWILLLQVLCEETPSSIVKQLASEWVYEANEDI